MIPRLRNASITEAAGNLHISQPAVSKALKQLEAELGLRLFDRTTKGVAATEETRLLYTEVERTYFGMQNLGRFAASLGHRKQGRIRRNSRSRLAENISRSTNTM